jgi:hypothetical protein
MGKPKTSTTSRRTKTRRSHLVLDLARQVNKKSPVKVRTTRRQTGKALTAAIKAITTTAAQKPAAEAKKAPVKAPAKKAA